LESVPWKSGAWVVWEKAKVVVRRERAKSFMWASLGVFCALEGSRAKARTTTNAKVAEEERKGRGGEQATANADPPLREG
jgi:hypothetical protein